MSRAHVLVVDDGPDAAYSMAALLHLRGYQCESQLGGLVALTSARRQKPDIVLVDLHMPRMDGFEFVRRLREVEGCTRTPVVMITGFSNAKARADAKELGIARFFTKPVGLQDLVDAMEELLSHSQANAVPVPAPSSA
jgi:CheY-like chemotaxis protein